MMTGRRGTRPACSAVAAALQCRTTPPSSPHHHAPHPHPHHHLLQQNFAVVETAAAAVAADESTPVVVAAADNDNELPAAAAAAAADKPVAAADDDWLLSRRAPPLVSVPPVRDACPAGEGRSWGYLHRLLHFRRPHFRPSCVPAESTAASAALHALRPCGERGADCRSACRRQAAGSSSSLRWACPRRPCPARWAVSCVSPSADGCRTTPALPPSPAAGAPPAS